MRKIVSVLLLTALMLVLAACGGSDKEGKNEGSASGEVVKLRLAGQSPDDHPSTQALYRFVDKVKEQTDGRVEIKVYPANQLGDYTTVYQEVTHGTIEMALISFAGEMDPRLVLNATPYLIKDYAEIEDVLGTDSYIYQTIKDINTELGVEFLSYFSNGYGGLGVTKEIKNLTDPNTDKGLLLRTPASSTYKFIMEDLGFRTTTIPYADLYTAMQTGASDGWSGGEVSLNYTGFRDVIKHFYFTKDFMNSDALMINKNVFDKLTAKDQETLKKLSNDLFLESIEIAKTSDEEYLTKLEEYGINVIELSQEEIDTLAETARTKTWKRLESEFGEEITNKLIELYQ